MPSARCQVLHRVPESSCSPTLGPVGLVELSSQQLWFSHTIIFEPVERASIFALEMCQSDSCLCRIRAISKSVSLFHYFSRSWPNFFNIMANPRPSSLIPGELRRGDCVGHGIFGWSPKDPLRDSVSHPALQTRFREATLLG